VRYYALYAPDSLVAIANISLVNKFSCLSIRWLDFHLLIILCLIFEIKRSYMRISSA